MMSCSTKIDRTVLPWSSALKIAPGFLLVNRREPRRRYNRLVCVPIPAAWLYPLGFNLGHILEALELFRRGQLSRLAPTLRDLDAEQCWIARFVTTMRYN